MPALPLPLPAACVVVSQPAGPHTLTRALVIGATWPPGAAQAIAVAAASVVTDVGEVAIGAVGAVLSTVTCSLRAAVKFCPASRAPTWTVCVPSVIARESNEKVSGAAILVHGL